MSDYDQYLAGYRRGTATVWCSNPECPAHTDGTEVDYETEYGASWYSPEECPDCHGDWTEDRPKTETR